MRGLITGMGYFGSFTTYHLQCEGGMTLKVTLSNAARHEARRMVTGDTVWAWWDGSDVVVLTH